jgi:uncharacterized protein (DUF1684 family)
MTRLLMGITVFALLAVAAEPMNYAETIRAWQEHRDKGLRAPDSWLTLVGLFWLKPGENTIGSGGKNDFVLPAHSAPEHVGTLVLSGDKIEFKPAIAELGAARPLSYRDEKPDIVKTGSVSFFIIKRGDKFAVRAKDSESPVLKHFAGMQYFPVNPELRFKATLVPDVKKIPILNVLNATEMQESPGYVEFSYQGTTYHLRPIYEGEGFNKTLFFLFKDATNASSTYQAGRMLNTPLPVNGKVDLDFNRSYNPPCTFTPYATCPLPPKENRLAIAIEAGEKRYGSGHVELPDNTN